MSTKQHALRFRSLASVRSVSGGPPFRAPYSAAPALSRERAAAGFLMFSLVLNVASFVHAEPRRASAQGVAQAAPIPSRSEPRVRRRLPARSAERELVERHLRYESYIREAAARYELPSSFVRAVIRVESNYEPSAVSKVGAAGLMQLMPFNLEKFGVHDASDARSNILAGTRLLRQLVNRWHGDLVLTIASYNAGAGAVERYGGVPPFPETQGYVQRVLKHYRAYRRGRVLTRR